jgi:hypothetical protein
MDLAWQWYLAVHDMLKQDVFAGKSFAPILSGPALATGSLAT